MAAGQAGSTRDTARAGMDGRMNLVSFCFSHLLITSLGSTSSSAANKTLRRFLHISSNDFSWEVGLCTTRRVGGSAKIPRAW